MANQDRVTFVLREPGDLKMNLCHQRAGRIEDSQIPSLGLPPNGLGYTVGTEYHQRSFGYLSQFIYKYRAPLPQARDHGSIMNHFMTHIDRRAKFIDCSIDYFYRSIHSGTEAPGIRQHNFHF
jgi:hypothetical protein